MKLITLSLLTLSLFAPISQVQAELSEAYQTQRKQLAEERAIHNIRPLVATFNSAALQAGLPLIDAVVAQAIEGNVRTSRGEYVKAFYTVFYTSLNNGIICEMSDEVLPRNRLAHNNEVIYNYQYDVLTLKCADKTNYTLIETRDPADIWDQLNPFSNNGTRRYEIIKN